MDQNTTINQIANYRFALFGISLVWIFFRHTFFYNQFTYGILDPIVQIGDCGVDIFMFLSGFGLYHSFKKNSSIKVFYKKRVIRILPTTIILLAVFAVLQDLFNGEFRYTLFKPHYWIMSIYSMYWFIGAILLFYIFYPFLHRLILPLNAISTIIMSVVICIILIWTIKLSNIGIISQLEVYFARVPIFIIGALFAKQQKLFGYQKTILLFFLLSIPLLYMLPKSLQRISYAPLAIAFVAFIPYLLEIIPSWFSKVLSIIGKASLEFYLIHIFLFYNGILEYFNSRYSQSVAIIVAFGVVLACSWLCHIFISKINNFFSK